MAEADQTAAQTEKRKSSPIKRYLPIAIILVCSAAFFLLGGGEYISVKKLAENRDALQAWTAESPFLVAGVYMLAYIATTAFSLPIATPLTLAGGFVFGTWLGGTLTVVAATIGASILFIAASTAFADYFREKVGERMQRMRAKFEENAFSYILALRLAPIFPFVVVNVAPALAGAPFSAFVAATALGIIPGTFVYASVGAGLDAVLAEGGSPDLGVIFKPTVFVPLLLLALLALAPAIWKMIKARR